MKSVLVFVFALCAIAYAGVSSRDGEPLQDTAQPGKGPYPGFEKSNQVEDMLTEIHRHVSDLHIKYQPDKAPHSLGTRIGAAGDLPHNKTASTTKVIDGHVVTVNETTYSSGDDPTRPSIRMKIVEFKPSNTRKGKIDTAVRFEESAN